MKQPKYLLELVCLFSNSTSLKKEVLLAIEKPKEYLILHKIDLTERGVTEPIESLPWLALVNGLAKRNLLVELDWKDDPEETISIVLEFASDSENFDEIKSSLEKIEPLINDDIEGFLPILNARLKSHNLQLVWLDIDSDSYPLTIIKFEHLANAKELTNLAGYGTMK